MFDVMLFGHGWSGETGQVKEGVRTLTVPARAPDEGDVTFFITAWLADSGETYLIGTADHEPAKRDIVSAIARWQPKPAPFPHF
ncbi:FIG00554342: hypothetical protein [Cronobacter condimenti 1330]|uniref:Uncharacterized protein n=1 Tax=Cronobacter condimenti 1330 TaxID=1073999 RepID=K8ACQ8_9ENTR|nr:hypothetical protein [Cronobacter condimenti]ALB62585.1 hypothetical protein AFK62_08770 [Cronobacter condimenti 1330]CCJ73549.1 FIG00554342: hypothetical protein [Cronobacter condimenti 1330]